MTGMQGQQGEMRESAAVLNYRSAGAVDATLKSLLRRRDMRLCLKIFAMLVVGVPLLFVGPAVLASFTDFTLVRSGAMSDSPWRIAFILCSAVMIPILFWIEIGTDGRFFETQATSLGGRDDYPFMRASSYGEYEYRRQEGAMIAFTEILLFAPRITLSALRQWRVRRMIGPVDVTLAVNVLESLLESEHAAPTAELMLPGRRKEQLESVLAYLVFHEWADIAADGLRAWVSTETREAVRKARVAAVRAHTKPAT
jgi:hypothetical protein